MATRNRKRGACSCGQTDRPAATKPDPIQQAANKRLPKLPKSVETTLGPVLVREIPDLRDEKNEPIFGRWRPEEREIHVCEMPSMAARWITFYHERVHQVLEDAGAKPSDEADEERICDAIGTALVVDMLRGRK